MRTGFMYWLKGWEDMFVFLVTEVGDVVDGIPGVVGDKGTYSTVRFHGELAITLPKDAIGEEISAVPTAVFNRLIDEQIECDCEGVDTDKEENKELTELIIKLQGGEHD